MTEVRATAMATQIAKVLRVSRTEAFDAILAVAAELGSTGTRFSEKLAGEIESVILQNAKSGATTRLQRRAIGA